MTLFLLFAVLAACALGGWAGWRARPDDGWALLLILTLLCSAILLGALVVAAEAGSGTARALGLFALMAGGAALVGGFLGARRLDGPPDP